MSVRTTFPAHGAGLTRAARLALWVALLGCGQPVTPDAPSALPELRGFNFTHEGSRRRGGGYGSPEALASLDRLRGLGANTVAIVPYSFMADPREPTPLRIPRQTDGEGDERVRSVIRSAHDRELSVVLKPQIWLRRSWPGEIEMDSDEEWSRFFEHYRTWILHYAELAASEDVGIFSVGVELAKASRRTAAWRRIIADVRERFPGRLVYAANWHGELEHVEFWDDLDYLGVDAYFPLASGGEADDGALARGAADAARLIAASGRKAGKPVFITEAGFGSTVAAWAQPHASDERGREPDPVAQARSYEALIDALQREARLAGVLFWKWPSHGLARGSDDRSFSPIGKPAEDVIRNWWLAGGAGPGPR